MRRPLLRTLPVAALLAAASGCEAPEPAAERPNVVLVSIDTLRADHLGCYGYERPTSPALDRLAREGTLFENAFSTSSWTLPSHASLLSGRFPARHGALDGESAIAAEVPLLAELLGREGWRTAAVVNGVFLKAKFGFGRGFDSYLEVPKKESARHQEAVLGAVRSLEAPFFAFFHYMTVHSPYAPPPRYNRFSRPGDRPRSRAGKMRQLRDDLLSGQRQLSAEELRALVDLYDGGILHADALVGELLAALEERGFGDALVLVTADHGEEFLDHGSVLHNDTLFEEVIRVPLLVRGPGIPAGERVESLVSLADVVPTVLELAGVTLPQGLDGRSFSGAWQGRAPRPRALEMWTGRPAGSHALVGVRTADRKLVEHLESGRKELYDLGADPLEADDLYREQGAGALEEHLVRERQVGPSGDPVTLDPEEAQELRSLGYAD